MDMLGWIPVLLATVAGVCNTTPSRRSNCEGVFVTSREGTCYQFEVIELRGGHFRYWIYADVPSTKEYPLVGDYFIEGNTLRLQHDDLTTRKFTFETIRSNYVLTYRSSPFVADANMSAIEMASRFPSWILIKLDVDRVG